MGPGDGNCLFHSLSYGLGTGKLQTPARLLRQQIARFIYDHPKLEINGAKIEDWIHYETGSKPQAYARKIAQEGVWGGQVELAVCSQLKRVNVSVYESKNRNYSQAITFEYPGATKNIHVLYQGGKH